MEFNRILSLVIGAIVVILILVWVGGRLRERVAGRTTSAKPTITVTLTPTPTATQNRAEGRGWDIFSLFRKNPTPTPTKTVAQREENVRMKRTTPTQAAVVGGNNGTTKGGQPLATNYEYHSYVNNGNASNPTQIPNTGAPTLLIPLAISSLIGGSFLSRTRKK